MKKLLWVGDAGCPSGFARATHEILDTLRYQFEVTVLGINYRGDPHEYPYPIYAAAAGGDMFGVGRLIWMCDLVKPDVIVIQNDPWNIPAYTEKLSRFPEYAKIPVVAVVAVDGKNCLGLGMNGLAHAIFWTQFGLEESRKGGYKGSASVIPLGVRTEMFYPTDRVEARKRRLGNQLADAFIVGNVNRNQPRKRWDLTIKYFAKWVQEYKVDNAYLYLHTAPTGDAGVNVVGLAGYYGIIERLALMEPPTWYGIPEDDMRDTYNCFDVNISTTQGEGMGLTTLEAMACGIPSIVPDWAALGDWAVSGVCLVECTSTAIGPPYVNVIGGVADEELFVRALHELYTSQAMRSELGRRGLSCANQDRFNWTNIGDAWQQTLDMVLARTEAIA